VRTTLSRNIGKPYNVKVLAARKRNALNVIVQKSANVARSVFSSVENAS